MFLRTFWTSIVLAVCVASLPLPAQAQARINISGRLVNSLSGDPIPNAVVQIDELRRMTTSGSNGTFTLFDVPAGTYHLSVHAQGYSTRPMEVSVSTTELNLGDFAVDPELHFEDSHHGHRRCAQSVRGVLSRPRCLPARNSPSSSRCRWARRWRTSPASRHAASDRRRRGRSSAASTATACRSFRMASAWGICRANRATTASAINPAAAQRIEVVRGPATLLYGANAIGGLVNVITEDIPTRPLEGASGNVDVRPRISRERGCGGGRRPRRQRPLRDSRRWRRTPLGRRRHARRRTGQLTVAQWLRQCRALVDGRQSYFGASYGYDDTKYGVPVVEEGQIQLTPRRHSFGVARRRPRDWPVRSIRTVRRWPVRRYKHEELEGAGRRHRVQKQHRGDRADDSPPRHRPAEGQRRRRGSSTAAFGATGEEALSPDVDQRGFAAFLYEEVTWPHVTFQFGGRLDRTCTTPVGEDERSFHQWLGLRRPALHSRRQPTNGSHSP